MDVELVGDLCDGAVAGVGVAAGLDGESGSAFPQLGWVLGVSHDRGPLQMVSGFPSIKHRTVHTPRAGPSVKLRVHATDGCRQYERQGGIDDDHAAHDQPSACAGSGRLWTPFWKRGEIRGRTQDALDVRSWVC